LSKAEDKIKVAFIDIGTNSVRYLAVRIAPGKSLKILDRGLFSPRLGRGLAATGRLHPEAIERTLTALARLQETLRKQGVRTFRCVGTEALRRAKNAPEFLARAGELGLEEKVMSGEEEAELAYGGVRGLLSPGPAVVLDVGGGSTEIIVRREGETSPHLSSFPLGCVRLGERFPGEGDRARRRMAEFADSFLRTRLSHLPAGNLVGLGGTVTTLAALHLKLSSYQPDRIQGCRLTFAAIEKLLSRLISLPEKGRSDLPGVGRSRADIIIPGTIIVRAFLKHLRKKDLIVSDRGILFGMLRQFEKEEPAGPPGAAAGTPGSGPGRLQTLPRGP